jgi:hypothetical protein
VAQSDEILASQIVLNVLLEQDKRVFQDGHTFYFPFAARKPALFQPRDPQLRVETVWNRYLGDLYRRVGERRFDLVILNDWDLQGIFGQNPPPGQESGGVEYFQRFYERAESIPLSMTQRHGGGTFVMHVWRPRADVAAP